MIDPKRLSELLEYDARTGALFWRYRDESEFTASRIAKMWNTKNANKIALAYPHKQFGHLYGTVDGTTVTAHRAVWAMVHGKWPDGVIDHINGDPTDNRIENLRDVTQAENARNQKRRKNNRSGVTGVWQNPANGSWHVHVGQELIGIYADMADAVVARKSAEAVRGYHPNHDRI